jgi:spore coat polysaccharide biosynthesis protein SpsF
LCENWQISCFRGSEDDVLDRYYHAALEFEAEAVVRVTSDCPLIDPGVISRVVAAFSENHPKYDYVANTLERTFPRGLDVEVFSVEALTRAFRNATGGQREHVTRHMYESPNEYKLKNVTYRTDQSSHRWTVDTPEDFELIRKIIETLFPKKPEFTLEDCLELLGRHPEWTRINRHIKQKPISGVWDDSTEKKHS